MSNRLSKARSRFEQRIEEAENFTRRCQAARHPSAHRCALIGSQIEWVYEAAVLKVIVASEEFLEVTLGLYVIGERARSGYRPRRLQRLNVSLAAALELFRGDQQYVGWNDTSIVIRRAERFLRGGEPYQSGLAGASQLLSYMKKMRDAMAHESATALLKYERATRVLYGALPRRLLPGTQLREPPPTGITYLRGNTLFDAAMSVYRVVAGTIVP